MKYFILTISILLVQSCIINNKLNIPDTSKKQRLSSNKLIAGQWLDANSLNRLKSRDVSDPHPFNWLSPHVDLITCVKDGKPYFTDFVGQGPLGFLERKDGYYLCVDGNSKVKLEFSVTEKDTLLIYERQYETNDPFVYVLSKSPRETLCSYKPFQHKKYTSGVSKSYNYYYFEGEYEVKDTNSKIESSVKVSSEQKILGLPGVDFYTLETLGSHLMLELYEVDNNEEVINKQYLVLSPQEYGFDLHSTNFSGKGSTAERKYQLLDKVYEFKRKISLLRTIDKK